MARFRPVPAWRPAAAILLAAGLLVAASEAAHAIAGATAASGPGRDASCAVLVLGSPANADGSPTGEQELRVEAGIRGAREKGCDLLVVSGAAVRNSYKEASVMAALAAKQDPRHRFRIVPEIQATNTWENVRYSLPLLRGHARIWLASDALHAQRGRRYICKQQAPLCGTVGILATRRPWSRLPYRVASSLYELRAWIRDVMLF